MITVRVGAFSMIAGDREFITRWFRANATAGLKLCHRGTVIDEYVFSGDQAYGMALEAGMTWLKESSSDSTHADSACMRRSLASPS